MRTPSPLPPRFRGRAFLTTEAQGHLTPTRMLARDMQRISRGVRAVGLDLASVNGRCLAYQPRMQPGQAFSHITAAQLYRIPLPPFFENAPAVHVSVDGEAHQPRVVGVVGHRLHKLADRVATYRGFTVVNPVTTWIQLAPVLAHYDLVAAADFLVSGRVTDLGREPALATLEQLHEGVASAAGTRGVRKLRVAFELVRVGVDSRPETRVRLILVDAGLPEPRVNVPIYSASGERLGKPDLSYPEQRVVFEYEGDGHRSDKWQFRHDIFRRERFEAHGWRVIRVTADDVFIDPRAFVCRVRLVLAQRPRRVGSR